MSISHNMTNQDIKLLPVVLYQKRPKPYYWHSIEQMANAAHRNPPRLGDYLVHDGVTYQCSGCGYFPPERDWMFVPMVEVEFAPVKKSFPELIVCLYANKEKPCATEVPDVQGGAA